MTIEIKCGDCREILKTLPDESVNCIVTSPPYYGLRNYDVVGQIGLEQAPQDYVNELVSVFREAHRVLRSDGTLWLNLGDSYAGSGRGGNPEAGTKQGTNRGSQTVGVLYGRDHESAEAERARIRSQFGALKDAGLKPKDLIGVPWRVAFALQAEGWWLRQDIIWEKPNVMPESVRDRCTKSHEYLFMLTKSAKYYYDFESVKEPAIGADRVRNDRFGGNKHDADTTKHSNGSIFVNATLRNRRSVWSINTQPFKGAHFAVFPEKLVEPCILAGCPENGVVLDPFSGSGTVGVVAKRHNRNAILLDLNPDYCAIAKARIDGQPIPVCVCHENKIPQERQLTQVSMSGGN